MKIMLVIGKPETFMLEHMKKHRGMDPSRTLMVGDRLETDILFGHRGGLHTALVLTGVVSSREEASAFEAVQPDFIFDSIRDLVPSVSM